MIPRLTTIPAIALSVWAAPLGAETIREQSVANYEARSVRTLRVENARGVVRVTRGDPGVIRVRALKVVRSSDRDLANRQARETTVTTRLERGSMLIRVRYPQRQTVQVSFWDVMRGEGELPRVEVRLEVQAPEEMPFELASTSGDLTASAMTGPQDLETTSGDVTVEGGRAPVRIQTSSGSIDARDLPKARLHSSSGDIQVDGASGSLSIDTSSGDITVKGAEDSIRIAASSGDVHVDAAPRGVAIRTTSGQVVVASARSAVRIESESGDVTFSLEPPVSVAEVTTTSGDVTARTKRAVGCKLSLRTTSGSIDVAAPVRLSTATRTRVEGVIGDGRATIDIGSSSGDLSFTSGVLP